MSPDLRIKTGVTLCLAGLTVALMGLLLTKRGELPLLVFVGGFVYLPGSFLAFLSARGPERNKVFLTLRFIRLAFFGVVAFTIFRIMNP
ncbi:MAG: hypothetical protein KF857_01715 [Fimbriimonadaceae bacterium]|nr:hypothetical protein [Fimbriimonadaceae bacterium]